jgi:N-acetylmuramoyl-L-alanine amidase
VVKALIPKLQKLGHTVHNSTVDKATSNSAYLSQVVKSSNNSGAELFLSIHCNAYAGTSRAYGPLVFYNSSPSTTYRALSLAKTFSARFTAANAGYPTAKACDIREGNSYIVLKDLEMPALLLEIGFMTDAGDLALLMRADWQNDCARAIAEGVETAFLNGLIE